MVGSLGVIFPLLYFLLGGLFLDWLGANRWGWNKLPIYYDGEVKGNLICEYLGRSFKIDSNPRYRSSVKMIVYQNGLMIKSGLFFSVFHRNLYIEWNQIKLVSINDGRVPVAKLIVGETPIYIYGSIISYLLNNCFIKFE